MISGEVRTFKFSLPQISSLKNNRALDQFVIKIGYNLQSTYINLCTVLNTHPLWGLLLSSTSLHFIQKQLKVSGVGMNSFTLLTTDL